MWVRIPLSLKILKLNLLKNTWNQNIHFYWSFLYTHLLLTIVKSFINVPHFYKTLYFTSFSKLTKSQPKHLRPFATKPLWESQLIKLNYDLIKESSEIISKPHLQLINNKTNNKLFFLYLSFANGLGEAITHINSNFKPFFLGLLSKHNSPYVNVNKLLHMWLHTHTLLYNLFYNQTVFLTFSNKTLQKEAYAVNWYHDTKTYSLFRYSIPLFFLKNHPFGLETNLAFNRLADLGLECTFVTDFRYHYRTVAFLKKYHVYTIGLVPYNLNPWTLHYPIPVAVNSIFTQYFFLKLLFYIQNEARSNYYNTLSRFAMLN